MRILEEGRNWNDWVLQVECKNTSYSGCGAILEVNIADITHTKGSRYNYGWECYENADFYSFICPCCGSKKYIDEKKIPDQVKEIIKRR